jgi:hypothetical protein
MHVKQDFRQIKHLLSTVCRRPGFRDAALNMTPPARAGRTSRLSPGKPYWEDRPAGADRLTCRQWPAKVTGVQAIVEAALAAMVWGGRLCDECQFRSVKVIFSFQFRFLL